MKITILFTLIGAMLFLSGCSSISDTEQFSTRVVKEIELTQEAQYANLDASSNSIYEQIRLDNADRIELLRTFSSDSISHLIAAQNADVMVFSTKSGIHLLNSSTYKNLGFIALSDRVENLVISQDGRYIAVYTNMREVSIWQVSDLTLQVTIKGVDVSDLAFSIDGKVLVGINLDGILGWQVPNGLPLFSTEKFEDEEGEFLGGGFMFTFIPNTNQILLPKVNYIEDLESNLYINVDFYSVDLSTGIPIMIDGISKEVTEDNLHISNIVFSPNGSSFTIIWDDGIIDFLSLKDNSIEFDPNYMYPIIGVMELTFSPDGKYIGVVTMNNTLQVWDIETEELYNEWPGSYLTFLNHADVISLISGSVIQFYDLFTGEKLHSIESTSITDSAISPNGAFIALGENNDTIQIWSQRGQALEKSLEVETPFSGLFFSPNGDYLVASSYEGGFSVWQTSNWERLSRFEDFLFPMFTNGPGLFFAIDNSLQQVLVWENLRQSPRFILKHPTMIQDIRFSQSESVMAVYTIDETIWFWNLEDGDLLRSLEDVFGVNNLIGLFREGQVFGTTGKENTLEFRSINDGSLLYSQKFDFPIDNAIISADGNSMIVVDQYSNITYLWHFPNLEPEQFTGNFYDFLPSGDKFLTETYEERKIWSSIDNSEICSFSFWGHILGFSKDSSLVFLQKYPEDESQKTNFEILSTRDCETIKSLNMDGYLNWLKLSDDGSTLVGQSDIGDIFIWGIYK